jgi:hypothetical protein
VGQDAVCKPTKLIFCAIQPLIFAVASNELSMLITLSCDGIDDGVRRVHLDGSVCDLRGEVRHGMVYNDVCIL